MSRRAAATLSIVFLLVAFVAINVAADALLRGAHIDLTQNHLYTLSPGTKHMLAKLDEPITLKFYFSEKASSDYEEINAYGERVRDLLREFVSYSHGKLNLQVIDPEPFSDEEEMAESYGLTGAQTDSGEKVFLGIVGTNLVDGIERIPFLSPDREVYLEYDLASLISRLAEPTKKKLGILTSLPLEFGPGGYLSVLQGKPANPYVIYDELKQNFDVTMLDKDVRVIPDDIQAVLVAHPPALSDQALYALDQFALRGGRLIVLVDPFSESAASSGMGGRPAPGSETQSDLEPLLADWGVDYDPGKVVLDRDHAIQVQYGESDQAAVVPYIAWLKLSGDNLDRKDLVTADIDNIQLASAGALSAAKGATTRFTPLITTGTDTQEIPSTMLQYGGEPETLLNGFKSDHKRFTLAARVTGPIKTAFPEGPPPPPKTDKDDKDSAKDAGDTAQADAAPLPAQLKQSVSPLHLIVVADADFLEDRFWVNVQDFLGQKIAQPTSGNGFFIVNAVDQLMGSDDLISLRSRSRSDRPFTVVQALEERAQDRYRDEEQRLQAQVDETEEHLKELQGAPKQSDSLLQAKAAAPVLSDAQQREIRKFEDQLLASRRALREVQRDLRADVIRLGNVVKFVNIAVMPILVAIFAIVLAVLRRRKRIAARSAAAKAGP